MRILAHVVVTVVALALVASPACKKKEAAAPATEQAASAKAGDKGPEKVGDKAAAKAPEATAATPAAPAAPSMPGAEVAIELPETVVAYGAISSWDALFNAGETIAARLAVQLPPVPPRDMLLQQLTAGATTIGISTLNWFDKGKPVRFFFQDDNPKDPQGGLVVMLPATSKDAVVGAIPAAKKDGEDRLILPAAGKEIYIDFLPGYAVVTTEKDRFGKVKAFASGAFSTITLPGIVYVGASVSNTAKVHAAEIEKIIATLEKGEPLVPGMKLPREMQAQAKFYAVLARRLVAELDRFEAFVAGDADNVKLAFRVKAKAGTQMEKSLGSGLGRSPIEIAKLLPATAYAVMAANQDPAVAVAQIDESYKLLVDVLALPEAEREKFKADFKALVEGQTGESAFAFFKDGDAALGAAALVGAKDPKASLETFARFVGKVMVAVMDQAEARKKSAGAAPAGKGGKRAKAAPAAAAGAQDPMMVEFKKGLAQGSLKPFFEGLKTKVAPMGITISTSTTNEGGAACDTIDLAVDWSKMGPQGEMGKATIGSKVSLAACALPKHVYFGAGPGAVENARKIAAGTAGGLTEQAPFKETLTRGAPRPSVVFYANIGLGYAAFKPVLDKQPATAKWADAFPADRAIAVTFGLAGSTGELSFDVPVALVAGIKKAAMPSAPAGAAAPATPAPAPVAPAAPKAP